ncbi:hypothetical protein MASR1M68_14290 [Elusimicrobiota bacterium]
MKIINKIPLIFLGLFGALVILELSMHLAGFAMYGYRDYKNNRELKNKKQYTIMCIGESTTFGGYPDQLQNILNKKYPNKFSVVDCGVPGIRMKNILEKLDADIAKYKPDFAICMIGINNGFLSFSENNQDKINTKYEKFKLYKLYNSLRKHIKSMSPVKKAYADNIKNLDINYAFELYMQKKYADAERICEKIIEIRNNDYNIHSLLAMLRYYHLDKEDSAYTIASDIIETDKKVRNSWKQVMYEIAVDYSIKNKNNDQIQKYIEKLINDNNVEFNGRMYWFVKDFISPDQKKEFFRRMADNTEDIDQYYGLIAIDSMAEKDFKKAEEYFAIAEEIRLKYPKESTYNLYKLILDKLIKNNVKVLCMQYPIRSIESLKNNLKDEQYYARIELISNEHIFKQQLKEKKYNELFKDQFAGDFGHCTDFANRLIAGNVAETLQNLLSRKELF